uniref:Uncharacterized protein n=1 Tax=Brassica oleracea TaxID=3712 RepID=A0A3P6BDH1_BRAOL|nr:unnamed protein product [Brassica oleracea]
MNRETEKGALKMKKDEIGGSADLHSAARPGYLAAVQSVVSSNSLSVNHRDKHSCDSLHLAAWAGDVVSYLCKNKADVDVAAVDDMGAIHFASQKGHLEVVRSVGRYSGFSLGPRQEEN